MINPRNINLTKKSSIYSEQWSELTCDLKAIEVMISDKIDFEIDSNKGIINIEGYTSEGLKIRIGYDIKAKRIRTHHPKFD